MYSVYLKKSEESDDRLLLNLSLNTPLKLLNRLGRPTGRFT